MFSYNVDPWGAHPTQAEGIIEETGQAFYFRFRGGHASLTISDDERLAIGREGNERVARYYEQRVVSEDAMPREKVDELVTAWLTLYLAEPRQHPALLAIQRSSRWS